MRREPEKGRKAAKNRSETGRTKQGGRTYQRSNTRTDELDNEKSKNTKKSLKVAELPGYLG